MPTSELIAFLLVWASNLSPHQELHPFGAQASINLLTSVHAQALFYLQGISKAPVTGSSVSGTS